MLEQAIGNFIAIGTGTVKDGEQIPLPQYQDGTRALRKQCYYFVSAAEVPTALTYIQTSGAFYTKCEVDRDGYAHVSLWQQSGSGNGTKVVSKDSYEEIKRQLTREGISSPDESENIAVAQMRILSERLTANYLVIAVKASSGNEKKTPETITVEEGKIPRGIIS